MAVITISRQFGAGGRTLGKMIAKQLNYEFLDDVIIQELAKRTKVTKESVLDMEKSAGSFFSKLIAGALSRSYMERLLGRDIGYIDENIYVEKLKEVVQELAANDNLVLLGRGSQYILADRQNTFHILLIADKAERIAFMQKQYRFSDDRAYQAVLAGQKRRSNLYAKFGKTDYNAPELYDMVVNTGKLSLEQATALICTLVE